MLTSELLYFALHNGDTFHLNAAQHRIFIIICHSLKNLKVAKYAELIQNGILNVSIRRNFTAYFVGVLTSLDKPFLRGCGIPDISRSSCRCFTFLCLLTAIRFVFVFVTLVHSHLFDRCRCHIFLRHVYNYSKNVLLLGYGIWQAHLMRPSR